jgi:hypothetical protein
MLSLQTSDSLTTLTDVNVFFNTFVIAAVAVTTLLMGMRFVVHLIMMQNYLELRFWLYGVIGAGLQGSIGQ